MMQSRGDLIGGAFLSPTGAPLVSVDPARDGELVLSGAWTVDRVAVACDAAASAAPQWAALRLDQRWAALEAFRAALLNRAHDLADAITRETGKLQSEANGEAAALVSRFDLVHGQVRRLLAETDDSATIDAWMTWRPHGVVGVIGPFNYPLHLCHAHVVPALLLGNTVVVKPSETTGLCGQVYAECALAAGLPAGVLNVVHGAGAAGAALVVDERVRGLCFTGSWATGRRIQEAALERPELLVALEMGGKNPAVVLADADLRQAAHEIAVGAYLTTGQRCTCTERVLVERPVADLLTGHLRRIVGGIRYGAPDDPGAYGGPMATRAAADSVRATLQGAADAGVELIARGATGQGPFFVAPTLHRTDGEIPGYTDTELFGPDLAITVVDDAEHAQQVLRAQRYGLAASVFTACTASYQRFAAATHSGLLHHNRTTNQASGALPFGGVGRSGNFRPAGSFAARNVVYPVASMSNPTGGFIADARLAHLLPAPDLAALQRRHHEEAHEELQCDDRTMFPRPMAMSLPTGGRLPTSDHWLQRLYAGDRMAREKKPGVVDLGRSAGP
jgi:acyl-CoA reductase-like NAD-dependent aldehyde dehydrogenase